MALVRGLVRPRQQLSTDPVMPFTFRPARREQVPIIAGLAGGTGSGKTYSALTLAKGMAGGKPFALVDTEAGRAKHYADQFAFDHGDLGPPFTADRYAEAIAAADAQHYPVIVVDSMSHEWAGEGGVLDAQEAELDRMAGSDWKKREACKMAAWIKPKMAHKQMVQRLLQIRAHLILCFRAEPKIEMTRENGKTVITEKKSLVGLHGWIPVTEKNLPFELTLSLLLMAEHPGVPLAIKLQEQHKAFFPLDKPITELAGQRLAEWAKGGAAPTPTPPAAAPATTDHDAAAEWMVQIGDAKTLDDVERIGRDLRTAKLSAASVRQLREAWAARKRTIETATEVRG
jgi:hypothetical protein